MTDLTLSDACSLIVDCEHKTAPEAAPGQGFGFSIGTPNIRGGRLLLSSAKRIDRKTFNVWTARETPGKNDIILTREAPVGETAFLDGSVPVCLGQRTVLLRPDPRKVSPRYLHYRLQGPELQRKLRSPSEGSTVAHLNVKEIRKISLGLLPPVGEQERIAETLGSLDDKIGVNARIAEAGEALMPALFSSGTLVSKIALAEITEHIRDQVAPETLTVERVASYSIPAFDSMRLPEVVDPEAIKSSKFRVDVPSVLISKLNPSIPRIWIADPSPVIPAVASTEFLVLRPRLGLSTADVWAACRQPAFTSSLVGKVTGTSNSHQRVKPDDLLATEIDDPRQVSSQVRTSISSIARRVHEARIESLYLSELRDTLLPRLMSGEIRVRAAERIVEGAT